MTKKFEKVPRKGMTAEEVLTLWQAGKLFRETVELTGDELLARCRQEALTYVSAIDEYAAPQWKQSINKVWEAIVADAAFADALAIKKGHMQGRLNRYIVTNIAFHLQALDIYQCDNLIELHKKLERVSQKNSIYKGAAMYPLDRNQKLRIRELKDVYQVKNK